MNVTPNEVFVPCAEELGKRHDYRSLQQLLQLIRENGYTDNKLHDDIIETCVRQTGSDIEQVIKTLNLHFNNIYLFVFRVENKIHYFK
jgi:hypothetical protein